MSCIDCDTPPFDASKNSWNLETIIRFGSQGHILLSLDSSLYLLKTLIFLIRKIFNDLSFDLTGCNFPLGTKHSCYVTF